MNLTFDQAMDIINKLTYKPGYRFFAVQSADGIRVCLKITGLVDSSTGKTIMGPLIYSRVFTGPFCSQEDLLRKVMDQVILGWERHEAREWFSLDGKPVDYPHEDHNPLDPPPRLSPDDFELRSADVGGRLFFFGTPTLPVPQNHFFSFFNPFGDEE